MAILSVDQFRTFVTTSLDEPAVQALLDAAERDIAEALGPATDVTERHWGGYPALVLDHRPMAIASVIEYAETPTPITLATGDYRVEGYILRRLLTGTNPAACWRGLVAVVDDAVGDAATRQRLQVELVQLDLGMAGGVSSERVGEWSVSYSTGSDYQAQRAAILTPHKPAMIR